MTVHLTKTPFMDIWHHAWYWMDQWGIPLEPWQKDRITGLSFDDEPTKESMAHAITLRYESLPKDRRPDEFKDLVRDHMIAMMNQWGWPEWGFKEVKHLKPEGE